MEFFGLGTTLSPAAGGPAADPLEGLGIAASIFTAFCWSLTSICFSTAGTRIGSFKVNQIRIFLAVLFLAAAHMVLLGTMFPKMHNFGEWGYMALSGFIGLFLGDMCYFAALVICGPKLAVIMMTISPAAAALLAWPLLNESISMVAIAGMAITIFGVALAVSGREKNGTKCQTRSVAFWGIVLGLLGGVGQGFGMVFSKMGLSTIDPATGAMISEVDALSGTLIRMTTASFFLWIIALFQEGFAVAKHSPSPLRTALSDRKALLLALCGAVLGPFFGVWSSQFAVKHVDVALSTTIMAAFPILVIPQMFLFFREKPRFAEVIGALAAVGGIALMMLAPKFIGY